MLDSIAARLAPADVVLLVPPFSDLDEPVYAAHLLQAVAKEAGFSVRVIYASLALAARIGVPAYREIDRTPYTELRGERMFAELAHGLAPSEDGARFAAELAAWADEVAGAAARIARRVVGATSSFQQIGSTIALLDRVKRARPDLVTIVGGANCEGEMARGVASLGKVDVVFSGESESTFADLLRAIVGRGEAVPGPTPHLVKGAPAPDLDALPTPDYSDFFEQRALLSPGLARDSLPCETSRGCWWGQKHHCTFCGDAYIAARYRERSPGRALAEIRSLLAQRAGAAGEGERRAPSILMVDDIMPHSYFRTLLPELSRSFLRGALDVFYMQKANLSLAKVVTLRDAGVRSIQPGIESLSTAVLRRMKKGVTAAQCVALLRYGASVGVEVGWNLVHGFPGDQESEYEEMLALFPLLRHLPPPTGPSMVRIDRFSPYFDRPEEHGIRSLRPLPGYFQAFPETADVARLAYHFEGEYDCDSRPGSRVIEALGAEIEAWRRAQMGPSRPALSIHALPRPGTFALVDTRGIPDIPATDILDAKQASVALGGSRGARTAEVDWAIERRLVVELDGWLVPLATASVDLLARFGAAVDAAQEEDAAEEARLVRAESLARRAPASSGP